MDYFLGMKIPVHMHVVRSKINRNDCLEVDGVGGICRA